MAHRMDIPPTKALDLTVPQSILLSADEVIERVRKANRHLGNYVLD
jgi:hypothetical protein